MTESDNKTKDLKFYSLSAIGGATFLGGPLAAGYLISENYNSLDDSDNRRNAILIGISATILLFCGIFAIPEATMDKFPNQILPMIYTGLVYVIGNYLHGPLLNQHKEKGNAFHSGWKAAGIGAICLVITLGGVFGSAYLTTDNELYDKYDQELAVFSANEDASFKFYEYPEQKSNATLLRELDSIAIPKWKENIQIIERTNAYENLPSELKKRNDLLLEYSNLRLQIFTLSKKIIEEETYQYDDEMDKLNRELELALAKFN